MSVVIIGGNECMTRRYKDICEEYDCDAKVYAKMSDGIRGIGSPDLIVLFTATMSHQDAARCYTRDEGAGRPHSAQPVELGLGSEESA